MKKSIRYISVMVLVTIGLFQLSEKEVFCSEGSVVHSSKTVLTGSFVDFFHKENWSQQQWENQFSEMKETGMNIAIIQFTAYKDMTWFNSSNDFTSKKYPEALARLLAAANKKRMDIFIGLYFDEEYWHNQTNEEWLRLHADRCIYIANEINDQFGRDPAFKGWYIPHEPEPNAYHSKELTASFNDNLINRISGRLHSFDSKPVSIAAFFNFQLTSPSQLRQFMSELCRSDLQIIMLQDGVGVNHVTLDKVALYYKEAGSGLYEDSDFKGEFWTDLETFSFKPQGPVTIDRIKRQLEAEFSVPYITRAVSFQYFSDMSPSGRKGSAAAALRNDYLIFIKSRK